MSFLFLSGFFKQYSLYSNTVVVLYRDDLPVIDLKTLDERSAILAHMEPFVRDNLNYLAPIDRIWQPTDYLPDFAADDCMQQLNDYRASAQNLSDEVLVVLVGDMVTEEALPSYAF